MDSLRNQLRRLKNVILGRTENTPNKSSDIPSSPAKSNEPPSSGGDLRSDNSHQAPSGFRAKEGIQLKRRLPGQAAKPSALAFTQNSRKRLHGVAASSILASDAAARAADVLSSENLIATYGVPSPYKKSRSTRGIASERKSQGAARSFVGSASGVLSRMDDFAFPASWVYDGASLQAPNGGSGPTRSIRIGIDFGTAYTKVAIGLASTVLFVRWGGFRSKSDPLFLPGSLSIVDGNAFVGRAARADRLLENLKLPFLPGTPLDPAQRAQVVVFLAWVMRYARAWLYKNNADLLRGRKLAWDVNIGCPTNAWGDRAKIDLYRHLGLCAWRLSQGSEGIQLAIAEALLKENTLGSHACYGLDGLSPVPEFVAQLAGYARSPQRNKSLHLLVDCGAGTVDIVTFNLHREPRDTEDRYPMLASAVEPLGSHFLMQSRLTKAGHDLVWDDSEGIPTNEEMSKRSGTPASVYALADNEFRSKVQGAVRKILQHTRENRSPIALAWETGLPIFLTGGGARCDVFREAVSKACKSIGVSPRFTPFPMTEAARQAQLEGDEFDRMSVASGLTEDAAAIGRIIPAREIPDFRKPDVPTRVRLDRDDLYPK